MKRHGQAPEDRAGERSSRSSRQSQSARDAGSGVTIAVTVCDDPRGWRGLLGSKVPPAARASRARWILALDEAARLGRPATWEEWNRIWFGRQRVTFDTAKRALVRLKAELRMCGVDLRAAVEGEVHAGARDVRDLVEPWVRRAREEWRSGSRPRRSSDRPCSRRRRRERRCAPTTSSPPRLPRLKNSGLKVNKPLFGAATGSACDSASLTRGSRTCFLARATREIPTGGKRSRSNVRPPSSRPRWPPSIAAGACATSPRSSSARRGRRGVS